jgi:hypothetical protein
MNHTVAAPPQGRAGRGFVATAAIATVVAMAATTLVAGLAEAGGVDFEVADGAGPIPLSGFAVVTGVFSGVGVAIAAAYRRWSARPAERFVWTAGSLTVLSLVPPFLSDADSTATLALVALHLVAAVVMIPALTRSLRVRRG